MFLTGKKRKQEQNKLTRRVDALLLQNFFTQVDFLLMSKRKALKVIKTIARIENKKLSKQEIKELYLFIIAKPKLEKVSSVTASFFDFVVENCKEGKLVFNQLALFINFIFTFRLNLKRIFRF